MFNITDDIIVVHDCVTPYNNTFTLDYGFTSKEIKLFGRWSFDEINVGDRREASRAASPRWPATKGHSSYGLVPNSVWSQGTLTSRCDPCSQGPPEVLA